MKTGKISGYLREVGLEILSQAEKFEEQFRGLAEEHPLSVDKLELHWVPGHEKSLPLHQQANALAGHYRRAGMPQLRKNGRTMP